MKQVNRILIMILWGLVMMSVGVSAAPFGGGEGRLSKFDYDLYMYPAWAGGAVYQENMVFYVDGVGNTVGGQLLYAPERILSVRSFGLDKEYVEGRDYVMTETGIRLTENTSIPVMPRNAYCNEADKEYTHQFKDGNGGAVFTDNQVIPQYYLSVSYTTSATWNGKIPQTELDHLAGFKAKLENKEPVTIAILGDSISVGYTTSGLNENSYRVNGEKTTVKVNIAPYMPTWPKLLCESLKRAYGYDEIYVVNWAIGGTNTSSACLGDMISRVISSNPHLVTIGFGMNEFWSPADVHGTRIQGIIEQIHTAVPEAGFVLLSSMLPNMLAYSENNMNLAAFETEYYNIQKMRTDWSITVAPVNSVYTYAKNIKGDFALIGGNQNHPNDFTARLYAQTVASVLGAYDTPVPLMAELNAGKVGETYSAKLDAYCTSGVTWKVGESPLPAGLALAEDGTLSGTPTESGTFTFAVVADTGTREKEVSLSLCVDGIEADNDAEDTTEGADKKGGIPWSVAIVILLAVTVVLAGAVLVAYKLLKI